MSSPFLTKAEIDKEKKIVCYVNNKKPCKKCEKCYMIRAQKEEDEATRRIANCTEQGQHRTREMIWLLENNRPLFIRGYADQNAPVKKIEKGLLFFNAYFQLIL
jgi:arginyl-tRNA--protein-N-Asp/Glu arginylyltransferase